VRVSHGAFEQVGHETLAMQRPSIYEKVVKVKADVAAYLINCFPSA